jgi:septal ring factor EnvC (AmiA/AmiB activator)
MAAELENITLEHLRAIRSDVSDIKKIVTDHAQQIIGLRKQINTLEANTIRIEEGVARLEIRIDKVEKRLGLIDAE